MKRSRSGRALLLAVLAAALAVSLRAADIETRLPEKPARFVTDRADVLGPGGAEALNEKLAQFERDTSNQILVWIDRRVPEGFTLEDFTVRAAQKWGAGDKQTDNGAVLFVFTEDRKVRIEVGYGLEGAIPDVTAKRILENEILPRFRDGDYPGGIDAGAVALMAAARGEYKGTGRTRAEQRRRAPPLGACLPWAIFFGIFFVLPWFLRVRRGFRTHTGTGWRSGGGFPVIFGGGGGGGGWSSGGGGGGSFGGFSGGGGSFGGGGASGKLVTMAKFFSRFDSERIVAAIADAEKKSTGEVRVHVTRRKPENLEERALRRFQLLGMTATKERNGVLLYIAPAARQFRVLGDVAIHEKCGPEFWKEIAASLEEHFRHGQFTEGVLAAIGRVGDALARHFPRAAGDKNELSDDVTED